MKIITQSPTKLGKLRVTVEIEAGDHLIAVDPRAYYRLGEPVSDVVQAHVVTYCKKVYWCAATQQWRD